MVYCVLTRLVRLIIALTLLRLDVLASLVMAWRLLTRERSLCNWFGIVFGQILTIAAGFFRRLVVGCYCRSNRTMLVSSLVRGNVILMLLGRILMALMENAFAC